MMSDSFYGCFQWVDWNFEIGRCCIAVEVAERRKLKSQVLGKQTGRTSRDRVTLQVQYRVSKPGDILYI